MSCTAQGCPPALVLQIDSPVPLEALKQSTIAICRNAECVSGSLAGLVPPSVTIPDPATIDATRSAHAEVMFASDTQTPSLRITWFPWADGEGTDGDQYRVELRDGPGTTFFSTKETVTYQVSHINPGPDPGCLGTCHYASIDRRTSPSAATAP
jgi:hypothetical protein